MIRIPREYNYEDVYMIPQKCVVNSRSECDISVTLGSRKFANPVIAANMKSVVDFETCKYLASKNMFYIMHRFCLSFKDLTSFIIESNEKYGFSSISIGIQEEDEENLKKWSSMGVYPSYITIDVAHAHNDRIANMIGFIKKILPDTFIIAGNVATGEAAGFLEDAGADCIKIFVAPGHACSTKVKTGFTRGTITCLLDCEEKITLPIIADGGISEPGHIAKALTCGATMVMAGFFMSGFDQNGGKMILIDGEKKYLYYGSASFSTKGNNDHVEGREFLIDYKGNMDDHIYDIECSLRSAVSYAGVKSISEMYNPSILFSVK